MSKGIVEVAKSHPYITIATAIVAVAALYYEIKQYNLMKASGTSATQTTQPQQTVNPNVNPTVNANPTMPQTTSPNLQSGISAGFVGGNLSYSNYVNYSSTSSQNYVNYSPTNVNTNTQQYTFSPQQTNTYSPSLSQGGNIGLLNLGGAGGLSLPQIKFPSLPTPPTPSSAFTSMSLGQGAIPFRPTGNTAAKSGFSLPSNAILSSALGANIAGAISRAASQPITSGSTTTTQVPQIFAKPTANTSQGYTLAPITATKGQTIISNATRTLPTLQLPTFNLFGITF